SGPGRGFEQRFLYALCISALFLGCCFFAFHSELNLLAVRVANVLPQGELLCLCTHTHTHTHRPIETHTQRPIDTHTHTNTHTHRHTHTYKHTHTYSFEPIRMDTQPLTE